MASSHAAAGKPAPVVITDAQSGASKDLDTRVRRYAITMGFRTLCFIAMIFVPGAWRWVLLGGAVFLPYVAVVLANQANTRSDRGGQVERGEPAPAPQLTEGVAPEIIPGSAEDAQ